MAAPAGGRARLLADLAKARELRAAEATRAAALEASLHALRAENAALLREVTALRSAANGPRRELVEKLLSQVEELRRLVDCGPPGAARP